MNPQLAQKIEALLAAAKGGPAVLHKSTFNLATNLLAYDLTPYAYQAYPVLTPLRNETPRWPGRGGNAVHWKLINGVNTNLIDIGVEEGKRSGEIAVNLIDALAQYKVVGLDASVTFEAQEGSEFYDDALAREAESLLNSMMIGEEKVLLWGNGGNPGGTSSALGTPPTPATAVGVPAGTLSAATYKVWVCGLTLQGYNNSTVAGGVKTTITRNNLDGSTSTYGAGSSNISAASNGTALSGSQSLLCTVAAMPGAAAYAWFVGTTAGTAALAAITTVNSVTVTAAPAGSQVSTAITADNSVNSLVFDGLIPQIVAANTAYIKSLDGATLTSDSAAGINEVETGLQFLWDNFRLGIQKLYVSSVQAKKIKQLVLANGGSPLIRLNMDAGAGRSIELGAGAMIGTYLNPFTGEEFLVQIHPNMPPGTMLGVATQLPYKVSNVPAPFGVRTRRDYYEIRWPVVTRQYTHGVYASECLEYHTPFAAAYWQNVG